jgi:hypothetical protein
VQCQIAHEINKGLDIEKVTRPDSVVIDKKEVHINDFMWTRAIDGVKENLTLYGTPLHREQKKKLQVNKEQKSMFKDEQSNGNSKNGITFTELYQYFIEAGFVPKDIVMNKVAKAMGYSGTNAHSARIRVEGYAFTEVEHGILCEKTLSKEEIEKIEIKKQIANLLATIAELEKRVK